MDRGDWQATVHETAKSQTRLKRLSMHASHVPNSYILYQSIFRSVLESPHSIDKDIISI